MSASAIDPGRLLMVGLPGPRLDAGTTERLGRLAPAGVILFARNLQTPGQTSRLLDDVRALSTRPPLLALDQEGGRVSRLEPWVGVTPTACRLARAGVAATSAFGRATARALLALGFNVDFAPVVDLSESEATNGIGDRSFGTDPPTASELAGAFLDGLQDAGIAGCLKHFPGLGSTSVDSHEELPIDSRGLDELQRADLVPYERLATRAASVMISHGAYPAVDDEPGRPASLSPRIVNGLLRETLGYRGLVVSDDLEMGAVAPLDDEGDAAVRAIAAGCDLVLYCADLERAEKAAAAITRRAEGDEGFFRRVLDAASNVDAAIARWAAAPSSRPDADAAIAELSRVSNVGPG